MNVKKILNIKNSISLIKYFDGRIGVIDSLNTYRIYSIEDYNLMGGFKINLPSNNPLENTVDISPDGNYLAIAIKGKRKTTIWDTTTKRLLHTLGWHKGEVLSVSFDHEGTHLLTGGMDGRVYLWSVEYGKLISSLPPHPDYVLCGAFSKNDIWAATGSYDKIVSITNISSLDLNYRKKAHRGAITKIKFLKNRMITGDKTGELIVWDYVKAKIIARLQTVADMVVDMTTDEKEEYLFVITKDKQVYLYDLKKYELITNNFIKLGELPTSILYISENSNLLVGTSSGSIYIFDIYEDEEKLKSYLISRDYDKAYELIKDNPFLERSQVYEDLENMWHKTLEKAHKLMEQGHYENAKQILKPFLAVPSKRIIIQNFLKDFGEFDKFKNAVLKRKYQLAYSLANQYPSFKDTIYYKKMEEDFKKVFNKAKELIQLKGQDEKVRELFAPFRGVSSKAPLIQTLFNNKQLFSLLRNLISKKDFQTFFEIVERNPYLYDTPEYEMAMKFAKKLDQSIKDMLNKGEFKKAISYADMLRVFPKYKDKSTEYIQRAEIITQFLNYLSENNFDQVENMIYYYPFLEDVEDYKNYKNRINSLFKKAELFSSEGDIKGIKNSLKDLFASKIYHSKILNMFKATYLNQLMSLLKEKERDKEKIEKGINNYISYFGFDNEIKDIIDIANKLKLNPTISSTEQTKSVDFEDLPNFIWE